ncbi:hypothetical protein O181_018569 [Austropuccinia psidii MF-1]|uniref:Uncharacterized protein n=1 Tax=Austropuccinia psidii MF-1 TaxID=1389203 RepID=A0A9Q3GTW5_9BASI|nr:hypothetical protein [Austropuccinia psidii MF-1]
MEVAEPSRRGHINSRRSTSFYGLLGGYLGISQGLRRRLGEAEYEYGKEFMEEEYSEDTEVAVALAGAPEASEFSNLVLSNKPLVSQSEKTSLNIVSL